MNPMRAEPPVIKALGHGLILLVLKEVDRGPQLAPQGQHQRFELGLNLGGHADL